MSEEALYVICKYGGYYRPNAAGYTNNIAEAGRYTLEEAIRHSHPNGPDGPRDGITYEPAPTPPSQHREPIEADREAAVAAALLHHSLGGPWAQYRQEFKFAADCGCGKTFFANTAIEARTAWAEHVASAFSTPAASDAEAMRSLVVQLTASELAWQAIADGKSPLPGGHKMTDGEINAALGVAKFSAKIATEALAALPLPKAGEGEAMTELQRLGQEFDAGEDQADG